MNKMIIKFLQYCLAYLLIILVIIGSLGLVNLYRTNQIEFNILIIGIFILSFLNVIYFKLFERKKI
jgi:ABC-type uncharacterized transport system permease subunit